MLPNTKTVFFSSKFCHLDTLREGDGVKNFARGTLYLKKIQVVES